MPEPVIESWRPPFEHDARLMADRMRLALLDYVEGLMRRGPLALILEDLQWADDVSLALLGDLLDESSDAPLFVFASARPELCESGRDPFEGRDVVRIAPRALGAADVAHLAESISGHSLSHPVVQAIAERSGGNPLFVEQLAIALDENVGSVHDVASLPLPLTVEAAVQSRLDHLPPAEKDLCKKASVFGRPFSTAELAGLGIAGAADLVRSLCRRDLMGTRPRSRGGAS
jgi:predicted ATPase